MKMAALSEKAMCLLWLSEPKVKSNTYLDMLELFAVPQLEDMQQKYNFQQDGASRFLHTGA